MKAALREKVKMAAFTWHIDNGSGQGKERMWLYSQEITGLTGNNTFEWLVLNNIGQKHANYIISCLNIPWSGQHDTFEKKTPEASWNFLYKTAQLNELFIWVVWFMPGRQIFQPISDASRRTAGLKPITTFFFCTDMLNRPRWTHSIKSKPL